MKPEIMTLTGQYGLCFHNKGTRHKTQKMQRLLKKATKRYANRLRTSTPMQGLYIDARLRNTTITPQRCKSSKPTFCSSEIIIEIALATTETGFAAKPRTGMAVSLWFVAMPCLSRSVIVGAVLWGARRCSQSRFCCRKRRVLSGMVLVRRNESNTRLGRFDDNQPVALCCVAPTPNRVACHRAIDSSANFETIHALAGRDGGCIAHYRFFCGIVLLLLYDTPQICVAVSFSVSEGLVRGRMLQRFLSLLLPLHLCRLLLHSLLLLRLLWCRLLLLLLCPWRFHLWQQHRGRLRRQRVVLDAFSRHRVAAVVAPEAPQASSIVALLLLSRRGPSPLAVSKDEGCLGGRPGVARRDDPVRVAVVRKILGPGGNNTTPADDFYPGHRLRDASAAVPAKAVLPVAVHVVVGVVFVAVVLVLVLGFGVLFLLGVLVVVGIGSPWPEPQQQHHETGPERGRKIQFTPAGDTDRRRQPHRCRRRQSVHHHVVVVVGFLENEPGTQESHTGRDRRRYPRGVPGHRAVQKGKGRVDRK
mmetsp:Transcript_7185/g.14704  ORF Transcript_7185/g.14704 Transcript_7185/m.14704 type:complete len:530 (+) Transcript_7185:215-1804(+)